MRKFNSIAEISLELRKADLQRQISKEELELKYNNIGTSLAKGVITSTVTKFLTSIVARFVAKRFM